MPYRHAHLLLLAVFPLAGVAFWPGYLGQISTAPWQMHVHGITASLWLALLTAQSWVIHGGRRELHRYLGLASLVLFPLFLAGGAGIFVGMAARFVAKASPFHVMYAPRLAWLDVVSVVGMAWFYLQALQQRRSVRLHAGYMLATVIFLLPPILGRLAPIFPPLSPSGPADFWRLGVGFQVANAVTAAVAFAVGLRQGKDGTPFLLAGVLTVVGALLFQFVGGAGWWTSLYARAAEAPEAALEFAAALAGMAVAYIGWTSGRPISTRAVAA